MLFKLFSCALHAVTNNALHRSATRSVLYLLAFTVALGERCRSRGRNITLRPLLFSSMIEHEQRDHNYPIETFTVAEKLLLMERLWERPFETAIECRATRMARRCAGCPTGCRKGWADGVYRLGSYQGAPLGIDSNENTASAEAERDLEIGADFMNSTASLGSYFKTALRGHRIIADLCGSHEPTVASIATISNDSPFSIYYMLSDDCVDIYAVLDARQNPQTIDAILRSARTTR